MTYTLLALVAVLAVLALDLVVLRTRLLRSRVFWISYAIILGFQLLVNGILTGSGTVTYDPATITGLRVVNAPVEDIGFGFAMTCVTLMAWSWSWSWSRRRLPVPPDVAPRARPPRGEESAS